MSVPTLPCAGQSHTPSPPWSGVVERAAGCGEPARLAARVQCEHLPRELASSWPAPPCLADGRGWYAVRAYMSRPQMAQTRHSAGDVALIEWPVTQACDLPIPLGNQEPAALPTATDAPATHGSHPWPPVVGRTRSAACGSPSPQQLNPEGEPPMGDARPGRTETERTRRPPLAGRLTKAVISRYASLLAAPLPLGTQHRCHGPRSTPASPPRGAARLGHRGTPRALSESWSRGARMIPRPHTINFREACPLPELDATPPHHRDPTRTDGATNGPRLAHTATWRVAAVIGQDARTPALELIAVTGGRCLRHTLLFVSHHAHARRAVHPSARRRAHGEEHHMHEHPALRASAQVAR